VDKEEIINRLDVKAFYSSELPSIKWNGAGMGMALCPFHEDNKPSLSANQNTGQFKCFGCNESGSVFDFYMKRHSVDYRTAFNSLAKEAGLTTEPQEKIIKTYDYVNEGFKAVRCKGYNPTFNPKKDYRTAKEAIDVGFTKEDFKGLTLTEIEQWEKTGGWVGWLIPRGYIVLDVEDQESIEYLKILCKKLNIEPPEHNSNKGKHFFFSSSKEFPGASMVYTKSGLKVTYRVGGKNYVILAPTNGRTWEVTL
jgi:hypothetical protein